MGKFASVAIATALATKNTTASKADIADSRATNDARDILTQVPQRATEQQVVSRASFQADPSVDESKDHFIVKNGVVCAGTHLIIDLYDAEALDDLARMESAFVDAVTAAGATLLHIHMHHFTPNGGISGVAVLAESHISVHTWPERRYAAFDVFMCGAARPELAVEVLKERFRPGRIQVQEILRGTVEK